MILIQKTSKNWICAICDTNLNNKTCEYANRAGGLKKNEKSGFSKNIIIHSKRNDSMNQIFLVAESNSRTF